MVLNIVLIIFPALAIRSCLLNIVLNIVLIIVLVLAIRSCLLNPVLLYIVLESSKQIMQRSGKTIFADDIAGQYGIKDIDGA